MFRTYRKYLQDNPNNYWFKRKLYGWGWVPATWKGWLITGLYLLAVIAFALTVDDASPPNEVMFTFLLPVTLLTISFMFIGYRTGEKPKWQWGLPKKK